MRLHRPRSEGVALIGAFQDPKTMTARGLQICELWTSHRHGLSCRPDATPCTRVDPLFRRLTLEGDGTEQIKNF
jgi:hypothetical protein